MSIHKSTINTAARLALGGLFLVFGLNGFFHFLPQPPLPSSADALAGAFAASGYLFPLIKGTEVLAGLLLLTGRYVPLALTVLAPVVVNILAFHLFLAPAGLAIPVVALALGVYLAYSERAAFAPMLRARSEESPVAIHARTGGHAAAT